MLGHPILVEVLCAVELPSTSVVATGEVVCSPRETFLKAVFEVEMAVRNRSVD